MWNQDFVFFEGNEVSLLIIDNNPYARAFRAGRGRAFLKRKSHERDAQTPSSSPQHAREEPEVGAAQLQRISWIYFRRQQISSRQLRFSAEHVPTEQRRRLCFIQSKRQGFMNLCLAVSLAAIIHLIFLTLLLRGLRVSITFNSCETIMTLSF